MNTSADTRQLRRIRLVASLVVIVAGLLQCWRYRHFMYPDGIQYVDMAQQFVAHGVSALVNGYWSPLYPALIGSAIRLLHPSAYWMYPVVQLVNAACYIAAVWSFDYFITAVVRSRDVRPAGEEVGRLPAAAIIVAGYAIFFVSITFLLNARLMSPDMLVAAVVLLASGLLIDATGQEPSYVPWGVLGAVLAVGYYAKAVMFPVSLAYLAVAALQRLRARQLRGPLVALVVFALLAAPLVGALSSKKGRPTFGETGALNYAWYVNGWRAGLHWIGRPVESGVPVHPVRQLNENPDLFEFRGAAVTYPPAFDASEWMDGLHPRFTMREQLLAFRRTGREMLDILRSGFAFLGPVLLVTFLSGSPRRWLQRLRPYQGVIVPAAAAIAMYLLVHIEGRMIAAQLLVIAVLVVALGEYPRRRVTAIARFVVAGCLAAAVITGGPVTAGALRHAALDVARGEQHGATPASILAGQLRVLGVQDGEDIAVFGNDLELDWAQQAGVHVVAEIPDTDIAAYASLSTADREALIEKVRRVGVSAIVARSSAPVFAVAPWVPINGAPYSVLRLSQE